jgi:hypothetical protein
MGTPRDESETQELELIDEWPIDLEGYMEGLMAEADEGKVLAGLKLPNDYEDGCFVFDIGNRSCKMVSAGLGQAAVEGVAQRP